MAQADVVATPARVGLAEAVRQYREARGYSARQLSLEAGLSASYVGKLESGEMEPSFSAVAKLILVLRMKPGEIFVLCAQEARAS